MPNINTLFRLSKKSTIKGQPQPIALTFAPSKSENNGANFSSKNVEPV